MLCVCMRAFHYSRVHPRARVYVDVERNDMTRDVVHDMTRDVVHDMTRDVVHVMTRDVVHVTYLA